MWLYSSTKMYDKSLTQRRLHSPRINSGIMKCIRKKYRWFRLLRNGSIRNISYKVCVLKTARQKCYAQRLCSFNNDMHRNWKVSKDLMGKVKKILHKKFIVDGVSTNDTSKVCNSFCNYYIDNPTIIHEGFPFSSSHYLDQI